MIIDLIGPLWFQSIKMLILIVDRSVRIIERLEEIISEAENITAIHSAVCYEEGKKLFEENLHDAVLIDIDLPGNESLQLLKYIKKRDIKTCVIILFIYEDIYMHARCKLQGADFFIDKYYQFEKIREVVDSLNGPEAIIKA
jgi:DNA-binding NarL/FixJ family response regulator